MHDDGIDLHAIDLRTLAPEGWDAVMRLATRRAQIERSRVFHGYIAKVRNGLASWIRRLLPAGRPAEGTG